MKLGQRLREVRNKSGLSQEALAERVNVSRQTISKWERGTTLPSADNLAMLSEVFDVPVDALLKEDWTPQEASDPVVEIVEVQVPVEVPSPRPSRYRQWVLLATLVLAAGITIGVLHFRDYSVDSVPLDMLESEVIDISSAEYTPLLLPWES